MDKGFNVLALKVKENIKQYSTVLITGNIGSEKSELLYLLENTIAQTDEIVVEHSEMCPRMPQCSLKRIDAEELGWHILKFLMCGKCNSWEDEFAPYEYIIIDDFDKLRGRTATQKTLLFHLCESKKCIVVFSKEVIEGKGYIDEVVDYFREGIHINLDESI